MKNSIFRFVPIILISFFIGCGEKESKNQDIEIQEQPVIEVNDYNVLIVPDLSNRINPSIHPKPIHDTVLIHSIFNHVNDYLKIKNRSTNQMDRYAVDFINRGILTRGVVGTEELVIDMSQFKGKLRNASEYRRHQLATDIQKMNQQVSTLYEYAVKHSSGSDIWNYFNESVHTSLVSTVGELMDVSADGKDKILKSTKNVVVLFTDGYIENANRQPGYQLDPKTIEELRKGFLASGENDLKTYIHQQTAFHLKKTDRSLKDLNVLVMEMKDRSLDRNGVARVQPTDYQIMKILWEKWLTDSGASSVEIYQTLTREEEMHNILKKFLQSL